MKLHLKRDFRCRAMRGETEQEPGVDASNISATLPEDFCNTDSTLPDIQRLPDIAEVSAPMQEELSENAPENAVETTTEEQTTHKLLYHALASCNGGTGLSTEDTRRMLACLQHPDFNVSDVKWKTKVDVDRFGVSLKTGTTLQPKVGKVGGIGETELEFIYFDAVEVRRFSASMFFQYCSTYHLHD